MRIIGGSLKGRIIQFLKTKNTRPLKDSVRENIFNILSHSNEISVELKNALIETFRKNRISFREFKLKKDNVETLGQLFSYFILETILIGKLTNINPFNQPAVEEVKVVTKKYLLK